MFQCVCSTLGSTGSKDNIVSYPAGSSENVRVIWVVITLTADLQFAETITVVHICFTFPLKKMTQLSNTTCTHYTWCDAWLQDWNYFFLCYIHGYCKLISSEVSSLYHHYYHFFVCDFLINYKDFVKLGMHLADAGHVYQS